MSASDSAGVNTLRSVAWVAHSHDVRQRPGTKTDRRAATWMAELLAHGLIKPSFVPPPEIRALRDLTRTRGLSGADAHASQETSLQDLGRHQQQTWRGARSVGPDG